MSLRAKRDGFRGLAHRAVSRQAPRRLPHPTSAPTAPQLSRHTSPTTAARPPPKERSCPCSTASASTANAFSSPAAAVAWGARWRSPWPRPGPTSSWSAEMPRASPGSAPTSAPSAARPGRSRPTRHGRGCEQVCRDALALGPIDILINNIGGRRENVPIEDEPPSLAADAGPEPDQHLPVHQADRRRDARAEAPAGPRASTGGRSSTSPRSAAWSPTAASPAGTTRPPRPRC